MTFESINSNTLKLLDPSLEETHIHRNRKIRNLQGETLKRKSTMEKLYRNVKFKAL